MATTLSLQNSINFVAPLLKNQPLLVSNLEPSLTAANMIMGTILGPPFKWRFNRKTVNFAVTNAGGTDYLQTLTNFGFIESQWVVDGSGNSHAMNGASALGVEGAVGRPEKIAPQYDDNAGNITFRLDKKPDVNYTVFLDYQAKAVLMTSQASLWIVPDEYLQVFNYGFLCLMSLLINDSRFPIFENYFIARLLGLQDGLSDQERNIFIANWTALTASLKRSDAAVAAGVAGRGR